MMEPPDFEQIARDIINWVDDTAGLNVFPMSDIVADAKLERKITESLSQVWNARGAADLAAIEADWNEQIAPYRDSRLIELITGQDR